MRTDEPLIACERLRVCTRAGQTILSDLDFTLRAGQRVVILGGSGAGKSTFLKCLVGLHPAHGGRIRFEGRDLDPAQARRVRSLTAFIGQEPILGADKVREALLLPFRFQAHRGREPDERRLRALLQSLGLPGSILSAESSRVSGGEKQRLALARALLLGQRLFLLDEVTSALDRESKRLVLTVLAQPGLTVLSVAHDAEWIAAADVVHELRDGRLQAPEV